MSLSILFPWPCHRVECCCFCFTLFLVYCFLPRRDNQAPLLSPIDKLLCSNTPCLVSDPIKEVMKPLGGFWGWAWGLIACFPSLFSLFFQADDTMQCLASYPTSVPSPPWWTPALWLWAEMIPFSLKLLWLENVLTVTEEKLTSLLKWVEDTLAVV